MKPEIVFTFPATMGGVASFNYNIINHSSLIKQFTSKVIMLKAEEEDYPMFTDRFNVDETIVFNYSFKENQYKVQERLNSFLGDAPGCIVTDNLHTLYAAHRFKNSKTTFMMLHDYYYVHQAIMSTDLCDVAIAHSSFFSDALFAANPAIYGGRTFYIPYGVKQLDSFPVKSEGPLNLVFLGRLTEAKGVLLLHEINEKLKDRKIRVNWTIIGKGPLKEELQKQWFEGGSVTFWEPDSTEEVYRLLADQDVFVFPTTFEGTPVSILECLANGVVTVTNDLPGGIRDIVNPETGFRCKLNDVDEFADRISELNNDRDKLRLLQKNCFMLGRAKYDIHRNADDYFRLFLDFKELKRKEKRHRIKQSRLDTSFMPNSLVYFLRKFRS